MNNTKKPELLAPAGSPMALEAAIEGGADAIYLGGLAFNARINAKNFGPEELGEAIEKAHTYGAKIYIAANTLIYGRELDEYLRAAEQAYLLGADAMIVADVGAAREIKKRIPIELHASTQLSGHNVAAARLLADAGFSRMVCAREMSRDDLVTFCKESPIESEVFVHGALCVCHSGQCLFSSVVGGRSGNRGECAQPCRLPYKAKNGRTAYPLSLKDLSFATHVRELCDMGVSSFKIEGRMKSPEYVRDVTKIWRRLVDERRDATPEEMRELARIFSRDGFTDGYYQKKINSSMLGVRSESDKRESGESARFEKLLRKIPIRLRAKIAEGEPMTLSGEVEDRKATVFGATAELAINAPLTRETVERNLLKFGATPYCPESIDIELDDGVMVPISALNALRRALVDELKPKNLRSESDLLRTSLDKATQKREKMRTALFYSPRAITPRAESFFERIFIPLESYAEYGKEQYGVMLPEVIYDSESEGVRALLREAAAKGAKYALVGNLGHLALTREAGLLPIGDIRLNAYNDSSVAALEELGFEGVVLSPELSLARQRDIGGRTASVVYGRLPLMVTEKCVGLELGGCAACESGKTALCDRRGVEFPVMRRYEHRSVIFNSVPIYMADRAALLKDNNITMQHFIFTVEDRATIDRIIASYESGRAIPDMACKRIK